MNDSGVLFFGKTETGKTARMMWELRRERRVVLVEAKCGQLTRLRGWAHLFPVYDDKWKCWSDSSVPDFFRSRLNRSFRVVIHFRSDFRENLELLCRLLTAVKRLALAVDELSLFAPPGSSYCLKPNLASVVVSGSHDGIRFYATAQRPSFVHSTFLSQAHRMLVFREIERNDLALLRNYFPPEIHSQVATLPNYVYVDWSDKGLVFIDRDHAGRLGNVLPGDRI